MNKSKVLVMDSSTDLHRYYNVLFALPSKKYLVVLNTLVLTLAYIVYREVGVSYTDYIVSLVLSITFYTIILYTLSSPLLNTKRFLGLLLIYSSIYLFWTIISTILRIEKPALTSTLLSQPILIALIIGAHGFSFKTIASAISYSSILAIALTLYYGTAYIEPIVYAIALVLTIGLTIYYILSMYRVDTYNSVTLGSLFLYNWLDKRLDIENVFTNLSVEKSVTGHIIYGSKLAIIHPDIHYGPFSNTGSSMFPRILRRMLRGEGVEALILHGMGSHDRNLVTQRDSIELAKHYVEITRKDKGVYIGLGEPYKVYYRDWEALIIPFSHITLVFLSRPSKGIDDIPYSVQEYAYSVSREHNIPPLLLVDSHNCENKAIIDPNELYKLVDIIVKEYPRHNNYTRDYRVSMKSIDRLENTLGAIDGVSILAINVYGKRVGIVYIPGNNMVYGLRERIIEAMEGNGYDYVEVVTNDEHTATGILSKAIYIPVHYSNELLEAINYLSKEALSSLENNYLKYSVFKTKLKVMGESAWKLLDLLGRVYHKAVYLQIGYGLLTPLLILVLEAMGVL